MKITGLSKKSDTDVRIFFDTGDQLILTYEIVLKKGLCREMIIDEDLYQVLIDENKKYFVKQKASNLLSRRMHSIQELKLKLRKCGYDLNHINEVISNFVQLGYLEDSKFSYVFIDEKRRLKKWGNNKIKAELLKRGVNQNTINELLESESLEGEDYQNALHLAEKKIRLLSKKENDHRKVSLKLMNYLYSRGFEYDLIKEVVKKVLKPDEDNL